MSSLNFINLKATQRKRERENEIERLLVEERAIAQSRIANLHVVFHELNINFRVAIWLASFSVSAVVATNDQ